VDGEDESETMRETKDDSEQSAIDALKNAKKAKEKDHL
jgi:hypothetical protein